MYQFLDRAHQKQQGAIEPTHNQRGYYRYSGGGDVGYGGNFTWIIFICIIFSFITFSFITYVWFEVSRSHLIGGANTNDNSNNSTNSNNTIMKMIIITLI